MICFAQARKTRITRIVPHSLCTQCLIPSKCPSQPSAAMICIPVFSCYRTSTRCIVCFQGILVFLEYTLDIILGLLFLRRPAARVLATYTRTAYNAKQEKKVSTAPPGTAGIPPGWRGRCRPNTPTPPASHLWGDTNHTKKTKADTRRIEAEEATERS